MKRFNVYCFGATPDEVEESPDGDWVRFEDADAWRTVALNAETARDTAQAAAKAYHAELEELRARVTSAEAELRRLGYGSEVIFCFNEQCRPICTSHVGDLAWDTAENRRRTFKFIDTVETELRVAKATARDYHAELEELRARVTRAVDMLGAPHSVVAVVQVLRGR